MDRPSVAAGEPLWVGLDLSLAPGWHSYWRTPGDSGLPTTIRWKLPEGFGELYRLMEARVGKKGKREYDKSFGCWRRSRSRK